MFVKPRFVQFLTSVSVAAMFIVMPIAGKFDASGRLTFASATATAQEVPDPIDPPLECEVDCGPPTDPVDPIDPIDPPVECEVDCGPPTDPIDPPTDPVDPPTDPVDPPIDECDLKGAPDSCFDPEPVTAPSPSDDDDDETANPPVAEIPAGDTPRQEGLDFVKTVRCQTACTASVTGEGEVTVTVTSTTTGGDTVKTTITQDGDQVGTRVVLGSAGGDKIIVTAEETFESEEEARSEAVRIVKVIPVTLTLNFDFPEEAETQDATPEISDAFMAAISGALDISVERFSVSSVSEG